MNIYVASGQSKEYRTMVLRTLQCAADLLNMKAENLSADDKAIIGNIRAIAAAGDDVKWGEKFYARGIAEVNGGGRSGYVANEGVDLGGAFYTAGTIKAVNGLQGLNLFAATIGHEGKHVEDYKTKSGEHAPENAHLPSRERDRLGESRANEFQLNLYRKLSGSSAEKPDHIDKTLQLNIKKPHGRP